MSNMQPWWSAEDAVTLDRVPDLLPAGADGRRPTASSVYRWCVVGLAGIRLRRFRAAPGRWATTEQEVRRWQAALTELAGESVR